MSEQGTTTKRDTSSKREQVFAWLTEHHQDGMSIPTVSNGAGVAFDTAKRYLNEWRKLAEGDDNANEPEQAEADEAPASGEQPEADVVVVDRAYLLTLEALRDQVIETQRLRRLLDER